MTRQLEEVMHARKKTRVCGEWKEWRVEGVETDCFCLAYIYMDHVLIMMKDTLHAGCVSFFSLRRLGEDR